MRIIDFEIYRYTLPLAQPLLLEGNEERSREGNLLFLRGEDHLTGVGEIAPLPGFSAESLKETEKQLLFLRPEFRSRNPVARRMR